jgi:hypothetical protein
MASFRSEDAGTSLCRRSDHGGYLDLSTSQFHPVRGEPMTIRPRYLLALLAVLLCGAAVSILAIPFSGALMFSPRRPHSVSS